MALTRFLLFVAALLTFKSAVGQCVFLRGIQVWPSIRQAEIQPRQMFLFSAGPYGYQENLRQIGRSLTVYLWSAHDSVALQVRERPPYEDRTDLQLLMQPSRPLLADSLYELRVGKSPNDTYFFFSIGQWNGKNHQATIPRWKVAATPDSQAPLWASTPTVLQKEYSQNSEGVNHCVYFSNPVLDNSPYLVRATIRTTRKPYPTVTYLAPWQGQLAVGWFTCGGNFDFASEETCTITFEALDAAGNRSSASGRPIPFQAPAIGPARWH
jgi:hypothetical protein